MRDAIWKAEPEEHDYPAAASYLSLLATSEDVAAMLDALRSAPVVHFKAKDLLRAANLALLLPDNLHVAADLEKIQKGKELSPILLIRGDRSRGIPLCIADGYHRVCASYHVDENTDIPCKIRPFQGSA